MRNLGGQLQAYQHLHHGGARRRRERLFGKITKENFLNLLKEIDIQIQKAQKVPSKMGQKKAIPRHIIIKMPKIKYRKRILKAAREKQLPTREFPQDCQMISQKKLCRPEEIGKKYSKLRKAGTYSQDCSTQLRYHWN